ncbi:hypothetical protein BHU24_22170 [Bacillus pseudomycoides]|nr:hypothetical protein [Bacillus pseudomycoides]
MLNPDNWPQTDLSLLNEQHRVIYLKRKKAIDLYFKSDCSVKNIVIQTGVNYKELSKFIRKCLQPNSYGSILGYNALIPYKRTTTYNRKEFSELNTGMAGIFTLLLATYPQLEDFLLNTLFGRKKNQIKEQNMMLKVLHKKFLQKCRDLGIQQHEYPFITKDLAKRSLERHVAKLREQQKRIRNSQEINLNESYVERTETVGKNHPSIIRPYRRVQLDGHKIDVILSMTFQTPEGNQVSKIIERVWLLVIIDEATRCILGHHLCINKEYSEWDVLKCLQNAVTPHLILDSTIPGLKISPDAGFPSQKFSMCKWALWDELLIDNAKANFSGIVAEKLKNIIGCSINQGPVNFPERRGIIERFFGLLAQNGFHRLPSTTGSSPTDVKRDNPEKKAIKYQISENEIEQLTTVLVAEYNATPHGGISHLSPLQSMDQKTKRFLVRTLGEEEREFLSFYELRVSREIRGKNRKPYIQYMNAEYRNEVIANFPELVGKELRLIIDINDLRFIRAFLPDGSDIGFLQASGKWGVVKHSLKTRKAIINLKNRKLIHFLESDDPIEVYQKYLEEKVHNDKSSRNKLLNLKKEQSNSVYLNEDTPPNKLKSQDEDVDTKGSMFKKLNTINSLYKQRFTKTLNY